MRNVRPATLLATLLLLCFGIGRAQEAAPGPTPEASDKDLATIYVYRYDHDGTFPGFWFLTKTLSVYFGEGSYPRQRLRKIAGLRKRRYFMMRLPPGTYSFDTTDMAGKLKLEAAAGGTYYLRFEQGKNCGDDSPDVFGNPTCVERRPGVHIEAWEQARKELLKVKPINPKNVQDGKLVIVPSAAPGVVAQMR